MLADAGRIPGFLSRPSAGLYSRTEVSSLKFFGILTPNIGTRYFVFPMDAAQYPSFRLDSLHPLDAPDALPSGRLFNARKVRPRPLRLSTYASLNTKQVAVAALGQMA